MKIKNHIIFVVLCALTILSGCAQWTITGQNSLLKVKETPKHELVGIYTKLDASEDRSIRLPSDVVAISLKTLYLKYIQ